MEENCVIQFNNDDFGSVSIKEEIIECETLSDEELLPFEDSLKAIHTKFVECSLCFKHLKESSLRQHMKTHIGLKPYKCSVCNSKFTRKGDVARHATSMHSAIAPKYKCDICGKLFFDRQVYLAHIKVHDKQSYYSCSICYSKFTKKEYFTDHVKYGNCYKKIKGKGKHATRKINTVSVSNIPDTDLIHLINEEQSQNIVKSDVTLQSASVQSNKTCSDLGKILRHNNSISLHNSVASNDVELNSINKIKISPLKEKNTDCEHIARAIKIAVQQSEETIRNIQNTTGGNMTTLQRSPLSEHFTTSSQNTSTEIHIKAIINDKIHHFSIALPPEMTFDATTPVGMKGLMSLISNFCSENGKVEGEIDVKITKKFQE